jgi:transcriptional regulator GlxA family with amidase domain
VPKDWYFLPMHRVAFVVYPGFELLDMSGPVAVFDGANHVLAQAGKAAFYSVDVLSSRGGLIRSSSGVAVQSISPDALGSRPDTLLVMGARKEEVMRAISDPSLRAWLPGVANEVPRFGSVCSGAFVLASLNLLDGRCVATHWNACAPLAKAYPRVKVDADSLYVVDDNLWTSAGVSTGIDMALAMVTSDLDSATASQVARGLVIYARRSGYQSQFSPLLQAQTKADSPFAELITWLMSNLHAPLDVSALAARAGLSERTFHRRFVEATGETPARFVEAARLDAARMLLARGALPKAVAARVGLAPAARLTEAFERRFGITPRLFRETHADP